MLSLRRTPLDEALEEIEDEAHDEALAEHRHIVRARLRCGDSAGCANDLCGVCGVTGQPCEFVHMPVRGAEVRPRRPGTCANRADELDAARLELCSSGCNVVDQEPDYRCDHVLLADGRVQDL